MRARIALMAALIALAACGDDDAATTTSTSTPGTTAATTTTTLAPLGDPVFTWTRIALDEASLGGPGEQEIEAVIVGPDTLVGIGSATIEDDPSAAVWTSTNGSSWTRVPHDESLFGGASSQGMHAGIYFNNSFVAVGFDYAIGDQATAVVWRSPDGVSWTRVANDEAVFGGTDSQIMLAVTAGGPGLVAVGWDQSGGESDGAVWTSPDGISWTRIPHDEALFGGAGRQTIYSVVAGGPGLVAVGADESGGDDDAVVWTSADGLMWERVADPDGVFGGAGEQRMIAVYPEGSPLIATGVAGVNVDHDALVWISGDGTSWELADSEGFAGPKDEFMSALVRFEGLVIVAGSEYSEATDTEIPVIWYSTDHGLTWVRADDPVPSDAQYQWVESLTVINGSILVVGGVENDDERDVGVWMIEVTFE